MGERKSRLVRSEVQPSLSEQAFVANRVRPFMDLNRPPSHATTKNDPGFINGLTDDQRESALSFSGDDTHPASDQGEAKPEPCGGCGETDPKKACIGCLHFMSTTPAPGSDGLETVVLDSYDAGILWGVDGGTVDAWHDYIRAELGRADEFYQSQASALVTREAAEKRIGEAEAQSQLLRKMFDDVDARCVSAESQVAALTAALEDALGLHQVTHIHALIRSALALKEGR